MAGWMDGWGVGWLKGRKGGSRPFPEGSKSMVVDGSAGL